MTDSPLALTPDKLEALINPGEIMPWHQLGDEPDDAFDGFFFFKSLLPGKRTLNKAYRQLLRVRDPERLAAYKGRATTPRDWSLHEVTYEWDARARAWDDHVRRALMSTELDHLEEMLTRHRDALVELQKGGMEYIKEHGFETAAAALRAIHHSMDREREMAGLPDITHLLVMDKDQLSARYQIIIQQLTMNVNVPDGDDG